MIALQTYPFCSKNKDSAYGRNTKERQLKFAIKAYKMSWEDDDV
ncbi:hypothetical protein [Nitrosopumilus sp.]|nr:hypothetical protein [Nitrosopumilus sp.]